MKSYPFDMMLNPRVGPDALAHRVAKVFGVKYVPNNMNTIDNEDQEGKKVVDEVKLQGIIDANMPKALAHKVTLILDSKHSKEQHKSDAKVQDVDNQGQVKYAPSNPNSIDNQDQVNYVPSNLKNMENKDEVKYLTSGLNTIDNKDQMMAVREGRKVPSNLKTIDNKDQIIYIPGDSTTIENKDQLMYDRSHLKRKFPSNLNSIYNQDLDNYVPSNLKTIDKKDQINVLKNRNTFDNKNQIKYIPSNLNTTDNHDQVRYLHSNPNTTNNEGQVNFVPNNLKTIDYHDQVKYLPSKLNTADNQDQMIGVQKGRRVKDQLKLIEIVDVSMPKALAHQEALVLDSKLNSEQSNNVINFEDVAQSKFNKDGKKCVEKLELVEETEYEHVVECDHSYDRRCHNTYATIYIAQQREECDDDYKKDCVINFEKVAVNETVTLCRRPLVKDCDTEGPEICRTEYESECWTVNEHNQVT